MFSQLTFSVDKLECKLSRSPTCIVLGCKMELEKCFRSLVWVIDVFIVWALLFFTTVRSQSANDKVPALFIFGDSLSDDGNNNYLSSLARSNFPPYGIDFPFGPTGRFCNGRTVVDYIGLVFLFSLCSTCHVLKMTF